ncbi:MAG: hypothetical protein R2932_50875 [Caldilineaceae bacterium]
MSLLGIHLTLLMGKKVPIPVPPSLMTALESCEVTNKDDARSAFQLIFRLHRSTSNFLDYAALLNPQFRVGNRVLMTVTMGAIPRVLMDGIITNQQLSPGSGDEPTRLTITGEDVSVMMDKDEVQTEHPAQPENVIALKLIAKYAEYGMIPLVIPPKFFDIPIPTDRTPQQDGKTDYAYLSELATHHDYVFYVLPGPLPLTNRAYWGPSIRAGIPQRALSIDMGPETNVESINFQNDALSPATFSGNVQDRSTNQTMPVQTFLSLRIPLATQTLLTQSDFVRRRILRASGGETFAQAQGRAQAETDAAAEAVTVEGELNAARYGDILSARGLVGLRGAGYSYDGLYYVKEVTHKLAAGDYKQAFKLTREGLGSTVPIVRT